MNVLNFMIKKKAGSLDLLMLLLLVNFSHLIAQSNFTETATLIFPKPQEIKLTHGSFDLNDKTQIIISANPSETDMDLAKFLVNLIIKT